jgi:hypothetical protein
VLSLIVALIVTGFAGQRATAPACQSDGHRRAERLEGAVKRGEKFVGTTPAGWVVRLMPESTGWFLEVTTKGRETEDLARLTPPWHFVPNAREIDGWHFRNADNTGPNEGSVNAPQAIRDFIFSPDVGRGIEYNGSGTTAQDVEQVRAFGRGWLFIKKYTLTEPRRGERAAFEAITFSACLTWPANTQMDPARR